MFKKQDEKAKPEIVETACPVHGSRPASVEITEQQSDAGSLPLFTETEKGPSGTPDKSDTKKRNLLSLRDPLIWIALMLACTSVGVNQWLATGRSDDRLHQRDWDKYVAALPAGEANAMEARLIVDEVRFELFGGNIDPITQSRDESSVFKLSRLYAARNRTPEAISTLEKAFKSWQEKKVKHFYPDLKDWAVLCRLYNQQHQYPNRCKSSRRWTKALLTHCTRRAESMSSSSDWQRKRTKVLGRNQRRIACET